MGFLNEAKTMLKQNIREYGMYIALLFIMVVFTFTTGGLFISSRNISNLINQTGYIAVLAVGMTLVIIVRDIDLSVGFLSGFLGALAAIMMKSIGMPVYIVIPLILVVGIVIGLIYGFLVGKVMIPAFVVTLAAWMFFRGALLKVTQGTGTIIISDKFYNAIGNGFIPDIPNKLGIHLVTLIIGAIGICLYIWSQFKSRQNKIKYNFEVSSITIFAIKLVFISAIIAYITWVLSGANGLSWTVVIVIFVVALYFFVTNKTPLGRHIYAVGGNPEAATLSGISVYKTKLWIFASMAMMAALSGILFSSRLQSATTTAGNGFELDAIAACFVGGTSPYGGVGKVTGSIVGAIFMMSLTNGMNLMGIDISYQYMVRGLILLAAVIFDVTTRNRGK
jgi:putative multiple sugar transport system permease protein